MLVDSHCHLDLLDLAQYRGDVSDIKANARSHGVEYMLSVAVDLDSYAAIKPYAAEDSRVFLSVGVHPNSHPQTEPEAEELARLASEHGVVSVGETGLDYYRSKGELEWQRDRFRRHIAAARMANKPLIIHCREARDDTLRIMDEEGAREVGGVMHCFSEDWATAQRAMELGFFISFSGIVTFGSAQVLKGVATKVPLDRLLVETDSPYLAPVPYRGKPNQPAYTRFVAEHIADLRGASLDAVAQASTDNFFRLFSDAERTAPRHPS